MRCDVTPFFDFGSNVFLFVSESLDEGRKDVSVVVDGVTMHLYCVGKFADKRENGWG